MSSVVEETRQYAQLLMASFTGRAAFVLAVVDPETEHMVLISNVDDRELRIGFIEAVIDSARAMPLHSELVPRAGNNA